MLCAFSSIFFLLVFIYNCAYYHSIMDYWFVVMYCWRETTIIIFNDHCTFNNNNLAAHLWQLRFQFEMVFELHGGPFYGISWSNKSSLNETLGSPSIMVCAKYHDEVKRFSYTMSTCISIPKCTKTRDMVKYTAKNLLRSSSAIKQNMFAC